MTQQVNDAPRRVIYINRKTPIVTYIIIAICAVIFIADQITGRLMLGYFNIGILSVWGMKINELISAGQVWRLITPVFLHADFYHIGFNMLALYMWGKHCEAFFGRQRYLLIFLLAGLLGTLGSYAFNDANGLGASGAVYGVIGSMLYFYKYDKEIFKKIFGTNVLIFIGISLVYGFTQQYIDNIAHLAGLAGGFLAAGYLGMLTEKINIDIGKRKNIYLIIYIVLALVLGGIGYVFT